MLMLIFSSFDDDGGGDDDDNDELIQVKVTQWRKSEKPTTQKKTVEKLVQNMHHTNASTTKNEYEKQPKEWVNGNKRGLLDGISEGGCKVLSLNLMSVFLSFLLHANCVGTRGCFIFGSFMLFSDAPWSFPSVTTVSLMSTINAPQHWLFISVSSSFFRKAFSAMRKRDIFHSLVYY